MVILQPSLSIIDFSIKFLRLNLCFKTFLWIIYLWIVLIKLSLPVRVVEFIESWQFGFSIQYQFQVFIVSYFQSIHIFDSIFQYLLSIVNLTLCLTFHNSQSTMYEQSSDSNYEIQSVLNDKIIDGKLYYFVKWKGYPHSQNSWEPEQHLKNVPQHLSAWKQMKNKLRKLDKVAKRKKDEESFDGQKYIKNNRPPGPISSRNKQPQQFSRKSKRIQEKDDTHQNRLEKYFHFSKDSDKRSQNQQSDKDSSKNSQHSSRNSLFSVLSQINKINKKRKEQQSQKRKGFLKDQKNPIPLSTQTQKRKRGRKKKGQKHLNNQPSNQINLKKYSKEKSQEQETHINNNFNKDQKSFQHLHSQEMLRNYSQRDKPQIYNDILHHSKDNIPKAKFGHKNANNSFEKKRAQLSNYGKNKKNFDVKTSQNKNLQVRKQLQTRPKNPLWIESPLNLFEQKQIFPQQNKNAAVFDELQQIALSNSKRMPNFLEMYGLRSNYHDHYTETKKKNVQIPNLPVQKQTHNRFIIPQSNQMSRSGIEISSGNDADESLIVIEQEDFMKGVKGNMPGKKIFLNEEYQEVSVNVDTKQNTQFQHIDHFKAQNYALRQPLPDPRCVHLVNIAGQNLYDFLYQNPALSRFKMKPLEYINALKKRAKQEIKKKGVCIDLNELERREMQRNWCVQNQNEEVWVSEEKESKQVVQQDSRNRIDPDIFKPQLPQALSVQEFDPISIIETSESQKQVSVSTIPSQQSGDIELLHGLESDILDLFMQRYPLQPITFEIKHEISKIVRKIAYENMEMETGLSMIEDWVDGCRADMINKRYDEKSKEQDVQEKHENEQTFHDKEKEINSNLETASNIISDDNKSGELIHSPPENSFNQHSQRTPITLNRQPTKIPQSSPQTIAPPSLPVSLPKPTLTIEEASIVKIVNQFYYKNEKCFKLLLKNNQQVNVHYLELKKNCPKVLFQYYEAKCQQFQQKQQIIAKQNIFF